MSSKQTIDIIQNVYKVNWKFLFLAAVHFYCVSISVHQRRSWLICHLIYFRFKLSCCQCFSCSLKSHPFPSMQPPLPWPQPPRLPLWYPRGPRGTRLLLPLQPHLHRKAPRLPPNTSTDSSCGSDAAGGPSRLRLTSTAGPRKYLRSLNVVAVYLHRFDRYSLPRGSNHRCSHSDSNQIFLDICSRM